MKQYRTMDKYQMLSIALALILAAACFAYYSFPGIQEFHMRSFFLAMILLLCFVPKQKDTTWKKLLDVGLCILSIVTCLYVGMYNDVIKVKFLGLNPMDLLMGAALVLLILEATRRKSGWAMPIIASGFIFYGFFGYLIPGRYAASHFSVSRIISILYTGTEGIFGSALAIMLSTIYLFIIFGGLLETTGAGKFIIEFSKAVCGRAVGGTAKIATISAMLFGSISGSAVANTAATGSFSIPLMKDSGYSGCFASAICAVASTGGQIMPPVMGAGAFLIAEMVGVSYSKIVLLSSIPALMFYLAIFLTVHYEAKKNNLTGLPADQIPDVKEVLKRDGVTFLPLVLLLVLVIFSGLSVVYSALIATVAQIVIGLIRSKGKIGFLIEGIVSTTSSVASTAICCACAGIVIGMISLSGLGYSFSSTLMSLSGGNFLLGLLLVLLLGIILGMGLPTTPAFILLASVGGTGLISMGIPPLVTYLVLFWFAQTSNVTPPVCMAAFTAAAISGESPMKVGLTACKLGLPLVVIPMLMVYRSLLFTGPLFDSIMTVITGTIGLCCFVWLVVGYIKKPMTISEYVLAVVGAFGTFYPSYFADVIGITACAILLILQMRGRK